MNFSIAEILVILLIALLVVKPEQLPEVANTLGRFVKIVQRLFSKIKQEVSQFADLTDENVKKREQK